MNGMILTSMGFQDQTLQVTITDGDGLVGWVWNGAKYDDGLLICQRWDWMIPANDLPDTDGTEDV